MLCSLKSQCLFSNSLLHFELLYIIIKKAKISTDNFFFYVKYPTIRVPFVGKVTFYDKLYCFKHKIYLFFYEIF